MNFKEGLRRVSILFSVTGALFGLLFSYEQLNRFMANRSEHQKFEALLNAADGQILLKSATAQHSVLRSTSVRDLLSAWTGASGVSACMAKIEVPARIQALIAEASPPTYLKAIDTDQVIAELRRRFRGDSEAGRDFFWLREGLTNECSSKLGKPQGNDIDLYAANPLGIKNVVLDDEGMISSIERRNGEIINFTEPESLMWVVVYLSYPLLGYFLPRGAFRVLTWRGKGFSP